MIAIETKCKCGRSIPKRMNSTIQSKLCPKCTLLQAQKSKIDYHRANKVEKMTKSTIGKKKQLKTSLNVSKNFYKTTAWNWCRKYVLLFYSNSDGIVRCCTSGRIMSIATADCHCGHYIKVREGNSTNYATAFDFRNLGPQTRKDNSFMGGRQDLMREWLVKQHGEDAIKDLETKRHTLCKLDNAALEYWSDFYRKKFNELLNERGMNNPWKK